MKKLYIPTSTLNFNNILSSESISPKAFYAIRNFGYSRWQEVKENNQENAILLYDEPFEFVRPASDMEDHPMLVEITTDKEYPSIATGVYYSDESIYLSPWRTRFIFFTEQDRRVALSISDSSLETKMIGLYHRQLYVETYQKKEYTTNTSNIPLNREAVDYDVRVNKMKGLLYGYYIGALLSSTPELTDKANTLQDIHNIFSSILSSESHSPTVLQHEKLEVCFANLKKFDPIVNYLQKVAKEKYKAEDIIMGLSKLGVVFPSTFDGERIINSLLYATEDNNPAYDWLKREKDNLRKEEIAEQKFLSTSSEEIVLTDNALSKIVNTHLTNDTEQKLMKAWVNDVLSSPEYSGKITTFAETLSDVVTRKAKEVYANSWDDSRAKVELNQMRRYIRAQESSITWKDDIFSAIAAVLAKGGDWEQLRSFMQSKRMSDYRMVFALYGELNGFANLTRDFTDNLFGLSDKRYVASAYSEIYRQLMGETPAVGKLQPEKVLVEKNQIEEVETKGTQADDVRNIIHDEFSLHIWQQEIQRFAKQEAIKKEKKRLISSLEQALVENGQNMDYFKFITMLDNYDGWTPTGKGPNAAWVRMQEHFVPDYYSRVGGYQRKPVSNKPRRSTGPLLLDFSQGDSDEASMETVQLQPTSRPFLTDNRWISVCADMIFDDKAKKRFIDDMEWFVGNHNEWYEDQKKGKQKGFYAGLDKSNEKVVERLSKCLENKLHPTNDKILWLADIYRNIPIEKIVSYLQSIYVSR